LHAVSLSSDRDGKRVMLILKVEHQLQRLVLLKRCNAADRGRRQPTNTMKKKLA